MSRAIATAVEPLTAIDPADLEELEKLELVYSDGEPLDSNWHRLQMNLLIDSIDQAMTERGREDFFVGGDMFVYYSLEQARTVAANPTGSPHYFRGPDVFFVGGVAPGDRPAWVVWREGGRYPDLIVELLSRSTAKIDRTVKKTLYAETFRTPEYFLYDPTSSELEGFRLREEGHYEPLEPDAEGRLPSAQLNLRIGLWHGPHRRIETTWVRLYDAEGRLIPTADELVVAERERADAAERERLAAERVRADAAEKRAEAAEAEVERLRARLARRK